MRYSNLSALMLAEGLAGRRGGMVGRERRATLSRSMERSEADCWKAQTCTAQRRRVERVD